MFQAGEEFANRNGICRRRAGISNLETLSRRAEGKGGAARETSVERDFRVYQRILENSNNSYKSGFVNTGASPGGLGRGLGTRNLRGFLALIEHRLYTPNATTWKGKMHTWNSSRGTNSSSARKS